MTALDVVGFACCLGAGVMLLWCLIDAWRRP